MTTKQKQTFNPGDVVSIITGSFKDQLAIVVMKDIAIELDLTKIHVKLCKDHTLLIMQPHILRKVVYPECKFKVGDRVTSNCSPFENGTVTSIDYKKIIMGTTPDDDFLYSYTVYVLIDNENESSQYIQDELYPLDLITGTAAVDVLKSEMTSVRRLSYETKRAQSSAPHQENFMKSYNPVSGDPYVKCRFYLKTKPCPFDKLIALEFVENCNGVKDNDVWRIINLNSGHVYEEDAIVQSVLFSFEGCEMLVDDTHTYIARTNFAYCNFMSMPIDAQLTFIKESAIDLLHDMNLDKRNGRKSHISNPVLEATESWNDRYCDVECFYYSEEDGHWQIDDDEFDRISEELIVANYRSCQ